MTLVYPQSQPGLHAAPIMDSLQAIGTSEFGDSGNEDEDEVKDDADELARQTKYTPSKKGAPNLAESLNEGIL